MIERIPLQNIPNQELSIILNNQECNIRLIQRNKKMYLSLWIGDDEVWSGLICHDRLPMAQSRTYSLIGNLVFVDTEGAEDPQYNRLGERWRLLYFTSDEILPDWYQEMIINLKGV